MQQTEQAIFQVITLQRGFEEPRSGVEVVRQFTPVWGGSHFLYSGVALSSALEVDWLQQDLSTVLLAYSKKIKISC